VQGIELEAARRRAERGEAQVASCSAALLTQQVAPRERAMMRAPAREALW